MYRFIFLLLLVCPGSKNLQAQTRFTQLCFSRKSNYLDFDPQDYMPGKKAFYLYENCCYTLVLRNHKQYQARILYIKPDSIVLTSHLNAAVARREKTTFDTLTISPADISTIRLISDRMMGLFRNVSLRKYNYYFTEGNAPKRLRTDTIALYTNAPDSCELVPYLSARGIDRIYERNGYTCYFEGRLTKDTTTPKADSSSKKETRFRTHNIAWVLPTGANQINGWALGLHTGNINGEKLTINGLNTSGDAGGMFISMISLIQVFSTTSLAQMSDSPDTELYVTNINGLSLSIGGIFFCRNVRGIAINGGMCGVAKSRGISISGVINDIFDFKGISIAGLRNESVYGRGIQIGLINVCKHFKGLQIGLWNVNSKRKLPLLNWGS